MKKVYLVTLCTCLVVIALVSASVYFLREWRIQKNSVIMLEQDMKLLLLVRRVSR